MHTKIIAFLALLLTNCQSHQNTFQLEGKWVDMACMDAAKNCKSRYPEIVIDFEMPNSLIVLDQSGNWKSIWTNNKWQSYSLKLENDYESLLFPNYKTNTLQYYDGVNKEFVYYQKTLNR
jgi:hypothetical protein